MGGGHVEQRCGQGYWFTARDCGRGGGVADGAARRVAEGEGQRLVALIDRVVDDPDTYGLAGLAGGERDRSAGGAVCRGIAHADRVVAGRCGVPGEIGVVVRCRSDVKATPPVLGMYVKMCCLNRQWAGALPMQLIGRPSPVGDGPASLWKDRYDQLR